jgi:hypothetical protein
MLPLIVLQMLVVLQTDVQVTMMIQTVAMNILTLLLNKAVQEQ